MSKILTDDEAQAAFTRLTDPNDHDAVSHLQVKGYVRQPDGSVLVFENNGEHLYTSAFKGVEEAVEFLSNARADRRTASPEEIERARDHFGSNEIEVDENALVSVVPGVGRWVQAWVWMDEPNHESEGEPLCHTA